MRSKVLGVRPQGMSLRSRLFAIWIGCLGVLICTAAIDAGSKRLDKDSVKLADQLAKDREASFSGEKAMSLDEFKAKWTELATRLEVYEEDQIELGKFGSDIKVRKAFTHLLYMSLRMHTLGSPLAPPPQDLVSRHRFLQELAVEGSCYTGGDPFPKKMADLLKASPSIQVILREGLDKWDSKHRKEFERIFPQEG